jgi:hypothetical protein
MGLPHSKIFKLRAHRCKVKERAAKQPRDNPDSAPSYASL